MERKKYGLKTLIIVAAISLLIGLGLAIEFELTQSGTAESFWKEAAPETAKKDKPATVNGAAPASFSGLAKKLIPTVVNISTTQIIKRRGRAPLPEFKTPFDEFFGDEFDKFFGGDTKRQSLGSGFILNKEGYIVTNNHVIENAEEITVTLSKDKKNEYPAKVIGRDPSLDIALIKIDTKEDLAVVELGNSDALDIGDWVVAIGNPFGLGGTVTAGIVSQKGRVINAGPYDDFIQTDASINPGNSGGPLFNLRGEVIGINTAIVAGGQGIGFAIPINEAKEIFLQLKEKGKATRGWIGVSIQEVTPDIAESLGLKDPKGALISSVMPGDPADKAGIKSGDVIVEFDGKPVNETKDLRTVVASVKPGDKTTVKVMREGKEKVLSIVVAKKKDEVEDDDGEGKDGEGEIDAGGKLGLGLLDLTPQLTEKFRLEEKEGVFVGSVKQDSPAEDAGIRRGDIIKEVNGKSVKNTEEFKKAVKANGEKKPFLFRIKRGENYLFVTVKIKEKHNGKGKKE